jgi:CheY-like chemotaxis protein
MALDFSPLKVLIVDDNAFMRQLFREVLVALDCLPANLRFAANGRDGLEALRDVSTDLIICDIKMAPMDGTQFTKHIRVQQDSAHAYIPIIICTGHTEIEQIQCARDAGANEILSKPINVRSLYERIRSIIERPRQFVRSDSYHGPDRRRQDLPFHGPDRRISGPLMI